MSESTALRLADELADYSEGPYTAVVLEQAAAEMRRLHVLNGELLEAVQAERKNYEHTLSLQQQSYEREIQLEIEAEREACIDDCNAEARDDGTAQRIIERIRARGQR